MRKLVLNHLIRNNCEGFYNGSLDSYVFQNDFRNWLFRTLLLDNRFWKPSWLNITKMPVTFVCTGLSFFTCVSFQVINNQNIKLSVFIFLGNSAEHVHEFREFIDKIQNWLLSYLVIPLWRLCCTFHFEDLWSLITRYDTQFWR